MTAERHRIGPASERMRALIFALYADFILYTEKFPYFIL